ncbi:MAG TPA: hypothetical protein VK841_07655 [Polyangiaceae bacterium]|jgi:hypothetical protein|nr:hypothetical protein [Polyangiaceae bacterium]
MRALLPPVAVLASLLVVSPAPSALAADPPPVSIVRGTIASIDAKSVSIKKADGSVWSAALAPDVSYATVEPRRFEQIRPTDFIGVTSMQGANGSMQAQEIHIFSRKGISEGSFPWDHAPPADRGPRPNAAGPANLTNGTVAGVKDDATATYTMTNASVTNASSMQLRVTYQGSALVDGKCVGHAGAPNGTPCTGVATIDVPPWTPVEAVVPGSAADVRPRLAVFAITTFDPQGKPIVLSMTVEKNGLKPLF